MKVYVPCFVGKWEIHELDTDHIKPIGSTSIRYHGMIYNGETICLEREDAVNWIFDKHYHIPKERLYKVER